MTEKKEKYFLRRLRSEGKLEKFLLGFFIKMIFSDKMNATFDSMEARAMVMNALAGLPKWLQADAIKSKHSALRCGLWAPGGRGKPPTVCKSACLNVGEGVTLDFGKYWVPVVLYCQLNTDLCVSQAVKMGSGIISFSDCWGAE